MKHSSLAHLMPVLAGLFLLSVPVRADSGLDVKRLDWLDQQGCFTPGFKAAVHEYIDTKKNIIEASAEEKELNKKLPPLQKQAAETEAKVAELQKELAEYDHTDDSDFTPLQKAMTDPGAKPGDQLVLAQAYVWAYPDSPHQTEAQQDLLQIQKKLADQSQAEKDAEAARVAAHAQLLQRVQARALSVTEWRDFLNNMAQEDVVRYLGKPDSQSEDTWTYSGDWTTNPATNEKAGLSINFNAARVNSVAVLPHS